MCFLKSVKSQLVEISSQPVLLHLVVFEKDLKSLTLVDFAVKPIQPVVSRFQLIEIWKTLTEYC